MVCVRQGFATIKEVYGCLDNVAMVTLAPELENACDAVEGLVEQGVVVSVGTCPVAWTHLVMTPLNIR